MNSKTFLCLLILISVISFLFSPGGLAWALSKSRPSHRHHGAAIPGPTGLPLVGLLFAFIGKNLPYRILSNLSKVLGAKPLMAFSVGLTRFVVSSHPDTAKELLNSSDFADRPVKESAYELLFHRAMGFAPYGEYWRSLRRISSTHLFSPRRIAAFGAFRRETGLKMAEEIRVLMGRDGGVEVRKVLHFGSLNNVMMSVFGRRYEFGSEGFCELEKMVREGYDLLGVFNWSDHFPLLGLLDLQGVRKRCKKLVLRVNDFVGKIIEDHRVKRVLMGQNITSVSESGDFVDVLLDLEKENMLTKSDMIAVLWVIIFYLFLLHFVFPFFIMFFYFSFFCLFLF